MLRAQPIVIHKLAVKLLKILETRETDVILEVNMSSIGILRAIEILRDTFTNFKLGGEPTTFNFKSKKDFRKWYFFMGVFFC